MKNLLILLFLNIVIHGMNFNSKIYVAGHRGLVGSAVLKELNFQGYKNIITRNHSELDLTNQEQVNNFFSKEKPEFVFLCAAKVGGIKANMDYPADFIYNNLAIAVNVIKAAYNNNVKKLLYLGSSCIYPRMCPQPINENYLLSKPLESTNEFYALAKIAGLKMCAAFNKQYGTNFISCMPTNLYGPNDNFNLETSHVLPALISKFCKAKKENLDSVYVWGTGNAKREFLHVDDLASALIFLMNNYNENIHINIGTGEDISIKELSEKIKNLIQFKGKIVFDNSKPDGTPRKVLDISKLKSLGWSHSISLAEGLKNTIEWYLESINS